MRDQHRASCPDHAQKTTLRCALPKRKSYKGAHTWSRVYCRLLALRPSQNKQCSLIAGSPGRLLHNIACRTFPVVWRFHLHPDHHGPITHQRIVDVL